VSKSVKLGQFSFVEYYASALIKAQELSKSLEATYQGPTDSTAFATFNNNKEDDATSDLYKPADWSSVESIVRNWMRQGKAGIRVKIIQKYMKIGGDPQLLAPIVDATPIASTTRSSGLQVDRPSRRV
jgi:hypothetical protein